MDPRRVPVLDRTLSLLTEGYAWLPGRRRRTGGGVVRARVMGEHAVGVHGPDAVRFFYDEDHVQRRTATPEPVRATLFGKGGVQGLDGEAHRTRKAMFVSLLMDPDGVADLVEQVGRAWDEEVLGWTDRSRVVLFDEVSRMLTRAVCRWAGVPVDDEDVRPLACDLVALIDGFGSLGPRHWRARRARGRRETWLARLVDQVRDGRVTVPEGSAVDVVTRHRDADGALLNPRIAAVELLNVLRPTVAICWFASFAAHALHLWPEQRRHLRADPEYAAAFADEVRRFYPLTPFLGARALRDLTWNGTSIPAGALVLLDVYGQHHDPDHWADPYTFDPRRFLERPAGRDELIPQGGGDPRSGHRCPGEDITTALLHTLVTRLAWLDHDTPGQDVTVSLGRMPARPRSGMVIGNVGAPTGRRP